MYPIPDDCKIVPATLGYSGTDTGDFYISFRALTEHIPAATEGVIAGWVVPKEVERSMLRDRGIHLVIIPRENAARKGATE